jgi:predicted ribosomally synthesized peptide with SipW-like signal peptide
MFLILVIALAAVGVGYALWSETLTITGTVQTGEVDVQFSQYPAEECIDIQGVLTCPEPPEKAAAANCTVAWSNTSTDPNDNGANLLQVTVTGMYPSYHCKVGFDVTSTGNVPVHVWLPKAVGATPAWVATNFQSCYADGFQLHQGQSTGKCTIDIHFTNDQAPPENSGPITFGWTILATQFNENPVADTIRIDRTASFQSGQPAGQSAGWAGWSCPAEYPKVVSGGVTPASGTILAQGPAKFGAAAIAGSNYPVYPHYTYNGGSNTAGGEEGWVVAAAGPTPPTGFYVICGK